MQIVDINNLRSHIPMNNNFWGKQHHRGRVIRSRSELRCSSTKERDIHTAIQQAKENKIKELKLISKPLLPQQVKNTHIIHHREEREMEGSIVILPRKTYQSIHPQDQKKFRQQKRQQSQHQYQERRERDQSSSHWQAFSRKNIHMLNSKLKQIRCSKYRSHPHFIQFDDVDSFGIDKLKIRAGSFQCRTLETLMGITSKTTYLKNTIQNNTEVQRESLNERKKEHYKKVFTKKETIRQKSPTSISGNEFFTTLKKKTIENDPHLLAKVIRNKSEKNAKEDLYDFVTKIIAKSKKN